MLESDMKDFSCTLPLGNSEDLFKIFYFFQNLLNFSSQRRKISNYNKQTSTFGKHWSEGSKKKLFIMLKNNTVVYFKIQRIKVIRKVTLGQNDGRLFKLQVPIFS